jgi:hypothetical protein
MKNQLTLVTTLFDIGRDKLPEGFSRDFDHYLNCFKKLLQVDYPMIIFAPDNLRDFINTHREGKKTHIVKKEISDLEKFTFIDQVTKIRTQPEWINRAGWIPDSPQAKLELYNPLVMSKQFFMNDASIFNVFDTKYFLWIDAGISNTIGDPKGYLDEHFDEKISTMFNDNKLHYVCFPYVADNEVHGFEKQGMDRYAGEETKYVARGGIFGGTRDAISAINEVYYNMLSSTLGAGYMGTEESVYTILTYQYPHLCTKHMIESNGLVYKFLEEVKNTPLPKHNELLSIYSLTFNKPKQFKMWVESFETNIEPTLKSVVNRYVINNSTDKSVDAEYQELFKKYDFTEIKFDNIGICGGRQFAAEHFSESNSKYMIFFEDDMLLYGQDDKGHCKNGYRRYFQNLITNSMSIMEMEKLDYLKLCFSELYGDNNDNWAWYNAPDENTKKEWFPVENVTIDAKKTKIDYISSFKAIPYAVGEYHYCNWPILFNQEGNQKVFLDTKFEHKFEQTWMSFVMGLMRKNEIKVGCVLGSAINHRRKYHYSKNIRRENEHFTN